ncbi:MAG: dethiobiotin synthase [Nitrosospira sp.]
MTNGYFVTGTDTGVGKTFVSCALLHAFAARGESTVGMKPVAAGCENGKWEDVESLVAASTVAAPRALVNPYALSPPIAPHIAARQSGINIDIAIICKAFLELQKIADIVIVEGIGGFLVPLDEYQDGAVMAQTLDLPIVLVVGMRLGCLNHALLTAHAIRTTGLRLAGWVANRIEPQMIAFDENVLTLSQRLGCPLLGILPFEQNADAKKLSILLNTAKMKSDWR